MYIVTKWFGTFIIDESGEVRSSILFPKDAKEIANRLSAIAGSEILPEEKELIEGITNKEQLTLTDDRLSSLFPEEVELNESLPGPTPEQFGFNYEILQEASLIRSKEQLKEDATPDKHIIHAINSINELTQTANLLSERLHEWYGLSTPEYTKHIDDSDFLKLILEDGTGSNQDTDTSTGENVEAIRGLARTLNEIYIERNRLEKYVKINVEKLAPNTTKLTGALITAKLIAYTGGIERLARVSASTIQLLGAEKALFRHLRDGSTPPKHGVIFQHPYLHSAPYWQRGKIARALATKISIAIRVDYYNGEYQGDRFEEELKRRIADIRKRYPEAPKKEKKVNHDKGKALSGKVKRSGRKRSRKKR